MSLEVGATDWSKSETLVCLLVGHEARTGRARATARLRGSSIDLGSVAVREFLVGLNGPQGEESQVRWSRSIDTNRYNVQIRITAVINESRPIAIIASVDECSVDRCGLVFVVEK